MPRARGVAALIQKKSSHVTLVLDEISPSERKEKKTAVPSDRTAAGKTEQKEKPKYGPEKEMPRPKIERGARRIFSRKTV